MKTITVIKKVLFNLIILFFIFNSAAFAVHIHELPPAQKTPSLILWEAILPYGSEQASNPASRAFTEFGNALSTINALRAAMNEKTENVEQWHTIRDKITTSDLDALLAFKNPYFLSNELKRVSTANKSLHLEKFVSLRGNWKDKGGYQFSLNNEASLNKKLQALGDFKGNLGIKKGDLNEHTCILNMTGELHLGTLMFKEMLASMEAFHWQLDPTMINQQSWAASLLDKENSDLKNDNIDQLNSESRELLSRLFVSAPHFTRELLKFSQFENLTTNTTQANGALASQIDIRLALDFEKIQTRYKATWQQIKTLLKHVSFNTTFEIENGQIAQFTYNAETRKINIQAMLAEGAIVTTNTATPIAIYPSKLLNFPYKTNTDIDIRFYGLHIQLNNLELHSRYIAPKNWENPQRNATLSMNLNAPPNVKVDGALLYILPSWFIDVLIPGTIETLITDVFNQVVRGNNNEGASIAIQFSENDGEHRLGANFSVEMPYEIVQDLLITSIEKSKEDKKEIRVGKDKHIFDSLRSALRKDFDHYYSHYH